jgi:hypothetical protein
MKPQVLVYGNRKEPDTQYPFSTQAEKEAAFLKLFEHLRKSWKVYDMSEMSQAQEVQYNLVRENIGKYPRVAGAAAIRLLTLRRKYEYEQWHIEPVPTKGDRISNAITPKAHWAEVKSVRTRREGHSILVTLTLKNGGDVDYTLVPTLVTGGGRDAWDKMGAASQYISDALVTEYKRDMYNAEGLRETLNSVNELRVALHMALHPETANPKCTPSKVIERVLSQAEGLLERYSNSPIEKLTMAKRRPTSLDEANEALAELRRAVGSSLYYLRKVGAVAEANDIIRTYKLADEKEAPVKTVV